MVEGFVPPREQIHATVRFDHDSAVAVEFDFVGPIRPLGEFGNRGAIHWFNEGGFSFRKGTYTDRLRFVA